MAKTNAGQNSTCSVRNFFVNFNKYESVDGKFDPLQYMSVRHAQQTKKHKIASNLHILLKFLSDAVEVKDHLCQCVTYRSLLSRCHADRQRLQKCAFVVELCSYSIQFSILSLLPFSFHLFNSTHYKIVFDLKVLISYFVTVCLHRRSFKNRNNNWSVESLEKNYHKGDARRLKPYWKNHFS